MHKRSYRSIRIRRPVYKRVVDPLTVERGTRWCHKGGLADARHGAGRRAAVIEGKRRLKCLHTAVIRFHMQTNPARRKDTKCVSKTWGRSI